jgi:hypothetical protein
MKLAQVANIYNPSTHFNDYRTVPADILSRLTLFAISLAGFYFLYRLIVSGYSFMTAMGDEARIQNVQKEITNSFIGLLVIISTFLIMQMIEYLTGIDII